MSLKDTERPVYKLKEELKLTGIQRLSLSLVGKVLSSKMVKRDVFMGVLKKIWRVKNGVEIEVGHFLGGMVRELLEVNDGVFSDKGAKFLCVRVVVEIDKPLRRCLRIDVLRDGEETVMLLRYERLSIHCYKCGKLGH
ncbi:hypothetical protein EZV62_023891 [Acer yangbiense]|uniref:Zinc knuckle CX2CX4HX4C domain-containing protein n=1 Tax=Acer yangbiense TaxID=1000413 RepID=A0A5C7H396_9ROSI|nr:hypothetical protein EZV62_023891 [Acer yangbiense]